MNIFVLDENPLFCAQYHCDKHVVKMILETAQLLSNHAKEPMYQKTHVNHPCSKWVAKAKGNFRWLRALGNALCCEYTYRYGRKHACDDWIYSAKPQNYIPWGLTTDRPQCMPEEYKNADVVTAYRAYYLGAKREIAKWSNGRFPPEWWT